MPEQYENEGSQEALRRMEAARQSNATKLHLNGLDLTEVPESIGQLRQLQIHRLDNNRLTSVPESLGQLAQLQELYLDRNRLAFLPESLGQLTQLQNVDLANNQLTSL